MLFINPMPGMAASLAWLQPLSHSVLYVPRSHLPFTPTALINMIHPRNSLAI